MFQLIIVITILLIALSYAAWRIRMVIKNAGGRCYGCPIKDACSKKQDKKFLKDKKCCDDRPYDDRNVAMTDHTMTDQKKGRESILQARTAKKKG